MLFSSLRLRSEENFPQFKNSVFTSKEKEMNNLRKVLFAMAGLVVAGATSTSAFAQGNPLLCTSQFTPLQMRVEGLAELAGDIVMRCEGGNLPGVAGAPALNTVADFVNITVTTPGVPITNRIVATTGSLTDSLLFVDEPTDPTTGPSRNNQNPCTGNVGVCGGNLLVGGTVGAHYASFPTTTGTPPVTVASATPINVFQGAYNPFNPNSITFAGVPLVQPGLGNTRIFRIKNIRVAVAGAVPANGSVTAVVSVGNPPSNFNLSNNTGTIGFVLNGLTFSRWTNRTTGAFTLPNFAQCIGVNTSLLSNSVTGVSLNFGIRFQEGFQTAFRIQDNGSIGGQNNPTITYNTESGFYNNGYPLTNGLSGAGRATQGTRLRAVFRGVPAGVTLVVSGASILDSSINSSIAAILVNSDSAGAGGTAVPFVTTPSFTATTGIANAGVYAVALTADTTGFTGTAVWEVINSNPNLLEAADFGVWVAFRASNSIVPSGGTAPVATVSGSFAPIGTVTPLAQPTPRFVEGTNAVSAFTFSTCSTYIMFPFVTTRAGFNTGVAIANTSGIPSTDSNLSPISRAAEAGRCAIYYWGSYDDGRTAPATQTFNADLPALAVSTYSLQFGGERGLTGIGTGFNGFSIAKCDFRYGHGYAFISDVSADKLAQGYLALIMGNSALNPNIAAETYGH
jgi:hypothetical protein